MNTSPFRLAALSLALATIGAPVLAQSSVTLGGRVDVGPQFIDDGATHQKRIDSGAYTASRLFMRGSEDLGGGLSALFYMESRFNADTGAQQSAAKFWNAGAYVGLSSTQWGTVTLGRQYVPIFWSFLFADDTGPLRLHGYSALQSVQRSSFARVSAAASPITAAGTLDSINNGIYQLNISSAFEDNLVVYKTPSFNGATAMLAIGAPEGYAAGSGKVYAGNVEYRNDRLYASVAYNQKRGTVPAGGGAEQNLREAVASAMYAVTPEIKLWGNLHPWKFESDGSTLKGRDWMLGASWWFGNNELWLNYAAKKIDDCQDCDSRGVGLGFHHRLSKKTELYASYARVGNDANAGTTLNGFAPSAPGRSVRGLAAGIAVTF